MKFKLYHTNINVTDIDRSLAFYKEALDLEPSRVVEKENFKIVFLTDGITEHGVELTCLYDHPHPYNLGENENHIAFTVEDFDGALAKHKEMGVVCFENKDMGIYFIEDPDGYWLEVIPANR